MTISGQVFRSCDCHWTPGREREGGGGGGGGWGLAGVEHVHVHLHRWGCGCLGDGLCNLPSRACLPFF